MSLRWFASLCLSLIPIFLISSCSAPVFDEQKWEKQMDSVPVEQLYAPHRNVDGTFYTPWVSRDLSFLGVVRWWLTEGQTYTEEEENFLPGLSNDPMGQIKSFGDRDFIVWIGHDTFLFRIGGKVWLTDPIFSKRALLPARVTSPAITASDINTLFSDVNILISHNHHDHLDKDSLKDLSPDYSYFVPLGMKTTIQEWLPETRITEMDWWQSIELGDGYELHCLPAQHWSRRIFVETNVSLWASFLLMTPANNLYFGGDSGYFIGYREIGRRFEKIDYALLPITAYHPRWRMHVAHMNVEEAVKAFQDLGARYFIPTQWGTFHLGDNPPGYPMLDLSRVIKEQGLNAKQFLTLDLGQTASLED